MEHYTIASGIEPIVPLLFSVVSFSQLIFPHITLKTTLKIHSTHKCVFLMFMSPKMSHLDHTDFCLFKVCH